MKNNLKKLYSKIIIQHHGDFAFASFLTAFIAFCACVAVMSILRFEYPDEVTYNIFVVPMVIASGIRLIFSVLMMYTAHINNGENKKPNSTRWVVFSRLLFYPEAVIILTLCFVIWENFLSNFLIKVKDYFSMPYPLGE